MSLDPTHRRRYEGVHLQDGSTPAGLTFAFGAWLRHGHDRILQVPERGLFGVFDGMGHYGDLAARAAEVAAGTIYEEYRQGNRVLSALEEQNRLVEALMRANDGVLALGNTGTTATVTRFIPEQVIWGHLGDSRLYRYREHDIDQITVDEGNAFGVYNALGVRRAKVNLYGALGTLAGDRYMICSDGITGDDARDELSLDDLDSAFRLEKPIEAAELLIHISRKSDDKSVIVIDIPR